MQIISEVNTIPSHPVGRVLHGVTCHLILAKVDLIWCIFGWYCVNYSATEEFSIQKVKYFNFLIPDNKRPKIQPDSGLVVIWCTAVRDADWSESVQRLRRG